MSTINDLTDLLMNIGNKLSGGDNNSLAKVSNIVDTEIIEDESDSETENVIDSFIGEYDFLSNNFHATQKSSYSFENIDDDGVRVETEFADFPTLEHAFQCNKTLDSSVHQLIFGTISPKQAKRLGRRARLIPNWDYKRIGIMERLLEDKFNQHFELKLRLLLTGDAELIQGNSDPFWGQDVHGVGENNLGKLLMKVRRNILQTEGSATNIIRDKLNEVSLGFIANWIDESKISFSDDDNYDNI